MTTTTSVESRLPITIPSVLLETNQVKDLVLNFWGESIDLFEAVSSHPSIIDELSSKSLEEAIKYRTELVNNSLQVVREMCERHRYLHPVISHFGRSISRCFPKADEPKFFVKMFDTEEKMTGMEELITDNLIRNGYIEVALKIIDKLPESVMIGLLTMANEFEEWSKLISMVKENNIEPVIEWLCKIRLNPAQHGVINELEEVCEIDYLINEALFFSYLTKKEYKKALNHARTTLSVIATRLNMEDKLRVIMTCFVYVPRSDPSDPYAYYFSEDYRQGVCHELAKWLCKICGMERENPLEKCLTNGRLIMPSIIQMLESISRMAGSTGVDFSNDLELPVSLTVDGVITEAQKASFDCYHSRFVCPILKVHSTAQNPPVRLRCGHVISNDALSRIINNSYIRCPYCNSEQSPAEVHRLWF